MHFGLSEPAECALIARVLGKVLLKSDLTVLS